MSRIGGNPTKSPTDELYVVAGRIAGGSGAATIKRGKGFSLTYVSTGVYKITPDVNFPGYEGGGAVLMSATHLQYTLTVTAYTSGGGTTSVTFTVASGGSATDLTTSEEIHFVLAFCRTTQP